MKSIIIGAQDFLLGQSFNDNLNNKGFSPSTNGVEVNKRSYEGILQQGRSLTEYSTNIAGNVQAVVYIFRNSSFYSYSIDSNRKIYETNLDNNPSHTLKASMSSGSFDENSDIIVYKNGLYISSTTNIIYDNFSFTPDEDWWTAVAGGSALTSGVPHKFLEFGGVLYCTNGNKIVSWDGTTKNDAALTLPSDWVISDITIINNYIYVAASYGSPIYYYNKPTKLFVWNSNNQNTAQGEYLLHIPNISTINEVNGKIIITGGRSIYEFTGYSLRHIANISTPINWKFATVYNGKLYYIVRTSGVFCYDPAYDSISNPVKTSNTLTTIAVAYENAIDMFSETNKFYRASTNNGGGTFYSNLYYFGGPVVPKKISVLFNSPLVTGCDYTIDIYDEKTTSILNKTISYAVNGAIQVYVDYPPTVVMEAAQIKVIFSKAADKAIKQIKLFYDEEGANRTR